MLWGQESTDVTTNRTKSSTLHWFAVFMTGLDFYSEASQIVMMKTALLPQYKTVYLQAIFFNRPSKFKTWNIATIIWVTSEYFRNMQAFNWERSNSIYTANTCQKQCLYTKQLMGLKSLRKYSSLFAWWVKYHKILHFFPECISCIKIPIQCITTFLIYVVPGNWLIKPIQFLSRLLQ